MYVAFTRPEEELHVFVIGEMKNKPKDTIKKSEVLLLNYIPELNDDKVAFSYNVNALDLGLYTGIDSTIFVKYEE